MHATDGDLQRLVRPHAGAGARRHRPGRRRQAPAVDRLDPHRARPGRAGARLHQMGRPAGVARRRARGAAARHLDRQYRAAGPGLRQSRRRDAGSEGLRAAAADRRRALHAARLDRGAGRAGRSRRRAMLKAPSRSADPDRPRLAQPEAWNARVALAEALGARVVTDLKVGASFPTDHPLHAGAPRALAPDERRRRSTKPTSSSASTGSISPARMRCVGADAVGQGHPGLARPPPPRRLEHGPPGPAAGRSAARGRSRSSRCRHWSRRSASARSRTRCRRAAHDVRHASRPASTDGHRARLAQRARRPAGVLTRICRCRGTALVAVPSSARLSSAPTAAAASAAARASPSARRWRCRARDACRSAICGDGDFLMGATALWTAVHYRIPLLIVVANNRSFYNDEAAPGARRAHARPAGREQVDRPAHGRPGHRSRRTRPRARRRRLRSDRPSRPTSRPRCAKAIAAVDAGGVAVVDVRVQPGYTPAMTAGLTRAGNRRREVSRRRGT